MPEPNHITLSAPDWRASLKLDSLAWGVCVHLAPVYAPTVAGLSWAMSRALLCVVLTVVGCAVPTARALGHRVAGAEGGGVWECAPGVRRWPGVARRLCGPGLGFDVLLVCV